MPAFDPGRLERLTGGDPSVVRAALQGLEAEELAHEGFLLAVLSALRDGDATLRHLAAIRLKEAACRGIDIAAAIPALQAASSDECLPPHIATGASPWQSIGAHASVAVAVYRLKTIEEIELRRSLAQPGWPGLFALAAFTHATEAEMERYVPILEGLLAEEEAPPGVSKLPSRQTSAAMGLTKHWLRRKGWTEISGLLRDPRENVRKGALGALDDAAEKGQSFDALLPALLALVEPSSSASDTIRARAANVLVWFVLRDKKRPKELFLHGTNVLEIPEVRQALKEARRVSRRLRGDR